MNRSPTCTNCTPNWTLWTHVRKCFHFTKSFAGLMGTNENGFSNSADVTGRMDIQFELGKHWDLKQKSPASGSLPGGPRKEGGREEAREGGSVDHKATQRKKPPGLNPAA
jgi:hypothetical protein